MRSLVSTLLDLHQLKDRARTLLQELKDHKFCRDIRDGSLDARIINLAASVDLLGSACTSGGSAPEARTSPRRSSSTQGKRSSNRRTTDASFTPPTHTMMYSCPLPNYPAAGRR